MNHALKISQLKKVYPNQLQALKSVDLAVAPGDFFALLGSNGAGKTTMIGIICGLLGKTSGQVEVFGLNQSLQPNRIKSMIGLMPQEFNFNPFEPIEEILINQAGYYGIKRPPAKQRAQMLLKKMQLWDKRHDMAKSLSGGMKRRLMLARALVHQPKILILDEPTAGVDIEIRHSIWTYLQTLNDEGMTIILTTHYLEEAEFLCRHIAILDKGKIVEQTSMKKLLAKATKHLLVLESLDKMPTPIPNMSFKATRLDDYSLQVVLDSGVSITDVFNELSQKNINITHLRNSENRLEALFLSLTKK